MTNDVNAGLLPTQADRDAAADLIERFWNIEDGKNRNVMRDVAADMRAGHCGGLWEEAFARHRIAHATPPPEAEGWRGLTEKQIEDGARQLELVLTEPDYAGMYDTALITALEAMGLDPVFAEAAPLPASPNPPAKEQE